jgi:hypothetical protein
MRLLSWSTEGPGTAVLGRAIQRPRELGQSIVTLSTTSEIFPCISMMNEMFLVRRMKSRRVIFPPPAVQQFQRIQKQNSFNRFEFNFECLAFEEAADPNPT